MSHILQALVQSDGNAIVSIDGIGAFDLVSRNAMLRGLKEMDTGDLLRAAFVAHLKGRRAWRSAGRTSGRGWRPKRSLHAIALQSRHVPVSRQHR